VSTVFHASLAILAGVSVKILLVVVGFGRLGALWVVFAAASHAQVSLVKQCLHIVLIFVNLSGTNIARFRNPLAIYQSSLTSDSRFGAIRVFFTTADSARVSRHFAVVVVVSLDWLLLD